MASPTTAGRATVRGATARSRRFPFIRGRYDPPSPNGIMPSPPNIMIHIAIRPMIQPIIPIRILL
jgi:hypothetical protein